MDYRIALKPAARRQLHKLPREAQSRIVARIERLAEDPYPPGVKKLKSKVKLFRIRDGNYRIIYTVRKGELLILIVRIGDRQDVYNQ